MEAFPLTYQRQSMLVPLGSYFSERSQTNLCWWSDPGKLIIICDLFMAQVIALGSLVLERPLDRDHPAGSPIRELTPRDDYVVDARGGAVINGVAMDPSPSPEENVISESLPVIRQLPPRPDDGVLIDLQNESKLHAWLLQGMTRRGKAHWRDFSDYYEEYKPTVLQLHAKEDNIKFDQYTKAFSQIGQVLDAEGRLMSWLNKSSFLSRTSFGPWRVFRQHVSSAKLLLNELTISLSNWEQ